MSGASSSSLAIIPASTSSQLSAPCIAVSASAPSTAVSASAPSIVTSASAYRGLVWVLAASATFTRSGCTVRSVTCMLACCTGLTALPTLIGVGSTKSAKVKLSMRSGRAWPVAASGTFTQSGTANDGPPMSPKSNSAAKVGTSELLGMAVCEASLPHAGLPMRTSSSEGPLPAVTSTASPHLVSTVGQECSNARSSNVEQVWTCRYNALIACTLKKQSQCADDLMTDQNDCQDVSVHESWKCKYQSSAFCEGIYDPVTLDMNCKKSSRCFTANLQQHVQAQEA